jgi:hypothetical protein
MPLATSATTEALAYTLASLRGLTPDEAVASALRAELEREGSTASQSFSRPEEPALAELMARIRRLGPWLGPSGAQLTDDLYDAQGLPR